MPKDSSTTQSLGVADNAVAFGTANDKTTCDVVKGAIREVAGLAPYEQARAINAGEKGAVGPTETQQGSHRCEVQWRTSKEDGKGHQIVYGCNNILVLKEVSLWYIEGLVTRDGHVTVMPVAMGGTFMEQPVSSFVAEAVALDEAIAKTLELAFGDET